MLSRRIQASDAAGAAHCRAGTSVPFGNVDASVIAKRSIPERHRDAARALRDDYLDGRHDLLAPPMLPVKAVNALKYSGRYDGDRLVEASRTLPDYGISLVRYRSCGPIAELVGEMDKTAYDASYLGIAVSRDATVYTADDRLLEKVADSEYEEFAVHIRSYKPF